MSSINSLEDWIWENVVMKALWFLWPRLQVHGPLRWSTGLCKECKRKKLTVNCVKLPQSMDSWRRLCPLNGKWKPFANQPCLGVLSQVSSQGTPNIPQHLRQWCPWKTHDSEERQLTVEEFDGSLESALAQWTGDLFSPNTYYLTICTWKLHLIKLHHEAKDPTRRSQWKHFHKW